MAPVADGPAVGEAEMRAALALAAAPGLGPARIRLLVDRHGSAGAALRAAAAGRVALPGLRESDVRRLAALRPAPRSRLDELRARRIRVSSYGTPGYPPGLHHLRHPPPVLYLRGPLDPPSARAVAIVGTRRATEYGRRVARRLAADLAAAGWTVVSGLARGIDAEAHHGALEAGGATVGVLGSGLDHVFPASSRSLFDALERRGLLVSEFEPETPPAAGLFPRRNRIIAALSDAVVVVQAGIRSGALVTVAHALELGREVFAVPGPVDLAASEGVHALLRDGAPLATGAADVLRALGEEPGSAPGTVSGSAGLVGGDEGALLAALGRGLEGADELAVAAGLGIGRALAALARLEIRGAVRSLPGGRFLPATPAG